MHRCQARPLPPRSPMAIGKQSWRLVQPTASTLALRETLFTLVIMMTRSMDHLPRNLKNNFRQMLRPPLTHTHSDAMFVSNQEEAQIHPTHKRIRLSQIRVVSGNTNSLEDCVDLNLPPWFASPWFVDPLLQLFVGVGFHSTPRLGGTAVVRIACLPLEFLRYTSLNPFFFKWIEWDAFSCPTWDAEYTQTHPTVSPNNL